MAARDNSVDEFRQLLAAATRAISHDGEVDVQFVSERPAVTGKVVRLTKPSAQLPFAEVAKARGEADAAALRFRHHDAKVHNTYLPEGQLARQELVEDDGEAEEVGALVDRGRLKPVKPRLSDAVRHIAQLS